jgi:hypothetical protein
VGARILYPASSHLVCKGWGEGGQVSFTLFTHPILVSMWAGRVEGEPVSGGGAAAKATRILYPAQSHLV